MTVVEESNNESNGEGNNENNNENNNEATVDNSQATENECIKTISY
ncbi:hypothetical protein IJU97_05285 [bacterium]|nr:hypothetical protein [bacterium]